MARIAYAASMNEETVTFRPHVLHLLVEQDFTLGKISRFVGDTYCKHKSGFYELWDEGTGTPTCPHCIHIEERLEKKLNRKP